MSTQYNAPFSGPLVPSGWINATDLEGKTFHALDVRGWGHLTGAGALNIHPDIAAEMQDSFREQVICTLNSRAELVEACQQSRAFFELLIAMVSGGADISDADFSTNINALLDLLHEALTKAGAA